MVILEQKSKKTNEQKGDRRSVVVIWPPKIVAPSKQCEIAVDTIPICHWQQRTLTDQQDEGKFLRKAHTTPRV